MEVLLKIGVVMVVTTGVRPVEVKKFSKLGMTVDGVSMRIPSGPDCS